MSACLAAFATVIVIFIASEHPWHSVASTCAHQCKGVALVGPHRTAGGAAAASKHSAAAQPAVRSVTTPAGDSAPRPAGSPTPAHHAPAPSPKPSLSRSASPLSVQVSYSLVRRWHGSFEGKFTIVNSGASQINGWSLSAVLPNDHVYRVWDANYQMAGNTLILRPPSFQQKIAPGATLTEYFKAHGSTTSPVSCTFNGSPC